MAPLCKGSSAEGGEGLFFLQPFHHFVVPLPLHRGGEIQTRLGDACKHAPHTCKSLYTKEPRSRKRATILISLRRRRTVSLRSSIFVFISAERTWLWQKGKNFHNWREEIKVSPKRDDFASFLTFSDKKSGKTGSGNHFFGTKAVDLTGIKCIFTHNC